MAVFLEKMEKNKDLDTLIGNFFESLNINPSGVIFIKPNLSARPPIEPGENTSLDFASALATYLSDIDNVKKVIFGHSSLLGTSDKVFPYEEVMRSSGFLKLKEISNKVELLNLDEVERQEFQMDDFAMAIPKFLLDGSTDLYINIGAFKTHMETVVSFSLKNQMGLLDGSERRLCHHSGELEKRVAAIANFVRPNLTFIDGIWAMEGNGPHHGECKETNLIFASDDMVEVDSLAATLIGLDPRGIEHIRLAKEFGVGNFISSERMEELNNFKIDFKLARKFIKIGKNVLVWPTDACSRCITALNESGKIYKKNLFGGLNLFTKAYLGKKKINIVIGNANDLKFKEGEKFIMIGNCAKRFADEHKLNNLNKCPPTVAEALDYLKKELDDK